MCLPYELHHADVLQVCFGVLCVRVQVCVCPPVAAWQVTVKVHSNSWRAGWKADTPIHLSGTDSFGCEPLRIPAVCVSCQSGLFEQSAELVVSSS